MAVMLPVPPKHKTLLTAVAIASGAGCVMVTAAVTEHPLVSAMVIVYIPAHKPVVIFVFPPTGVQPYVYGEYPPLTLTIAIPIQFPLQLSFALTDGVSTRLSERSVTTIVVSLVGQLASYTVQLYVPPHKPVAVFVLLILGDHVYV
jgi:hypothetical protein